MVTVLTEMRGSLERIEKITNIATITDIKTGDKMLTNKHQMHLRWN